SKAMIAFSSIPNNTTISSGYGVSTNSGGVNYGVGLFLLSIWAGPILCLLHLPRACHNVPSDVENDESIEHDNDEPNIMGDSCALDEECNINDLVRRRTAPASEGSCYDRIPTDLLSDDRLNCRDPEPSPSKQKIKQTEEARQLLRRRASFTNTARQVTTNDENGDSMVRRRNSSDEIDIENEII
nr:hypothetical protein [Chitinophagaceae bacterium]